mgnify:CR=1 FL=1
MRKIESLRDRHQKRKYEEPLRRRERAPIANNLLDEIEAYVDSTPEFQKVSIERKIENRATRLINRKPLEYDNHLGRFTISKGAWVEQSGSTLRGAQIIFVPASEEGEKGDEKLTIEVYHREKPPHIPGVANEVYIWSPYNIGYFSVQGKVPNFEDKKLVPNSQETSDAIRSLLPILFPALPARVKNRVIGVSER